MAFSFGAPAAQPAQPQASVPSFSFTGATPNPTPAATAPPTGNMFSFGNTSTAGAPPAQAQAPAGGSLYGQQQPAAAPAGGAFSFGTKPAQPTAPTTSLFGQSTNTAPAPSLFGQPAQTQPAGGPSLFGQPQQQPQSAQTGSLFGQPAPAQQPAGSSLFGQPAAQPQASTSSLIGQPQQQQQAMGGSLFGGQQQQAQPLQQSSLQASSSSPQSGVTKSTKFSELPEPFQKKVEELDSWIKQQKAAGQGINTDDLGKAIWRTTTEIKSASDESSGLTQSLQNTAQALTSLQTRFITEEEDVRRLAEIWETYKAVDGRPGALRVAGHKEWPAEFFGRVARGLEERVLRYRTTIAQLHRVVAGLTSESDAPSPQAISQTIHNHQNALVTLAAQLEGLQIRMNGLKNAYASHLSAEYRERTSSLRDPFDVAREEKGLAPVRA